MIKRKQLVGFMVGLLMVLSASWQISLAGTVVASDKPLKAVQEVNSIVSSDAVTSTVPFTDVTDQIDSSTLQTATTVPLLIRPWNGNWEQPGAFKITNPNPKTVRLHWVLDCETPWDSQGICRDSAGDVTLEPYHSLAKGFGLICANWRLDIQWDEGGSWGGSVTAPDS
ncbi:hypothetical protein KC963_02050, partial [Candidatus Saccharibacteria bacterium]|nr:hypothetical protein [Candidatus Saccharibacteria bacterium]